MSPSPEFSLEIVVVLFVTVGGRLSKQRTVHSRLG